MTVENLKSPTVTNLDAQPVVVATAGEGAPGMYRVLTDYTLPTAAAGSATGNSYRLARFPTNAKIKRVWLYTKGLDSNATATLALDVNVAFSDSTVDGTPSSLQGTIPTTANNGTVTTLAAYSTPNNLFGTHVVANSGAARELDITFTGTLTPANQNDDLWNVFGFTNSAGLAQDPGGMFDILVVVSATAATAAAGTLAVEVDFVV